MKTMLSYCLKRRKDTKIKLKKLLRLNTEE